MNDHLRIIFETILPSLENTGINYWVYGGVAIAGLKGEWLRPNDDVDVFVFEKDFEKISRILSDLAKQHSWKFYIDEKIVPSRPKCELFFKDGENDFLSVVPVFETEKGIKFLLPHNIEKIFPKDILERESRTVGEFNFFTPKREVIKELFACLLKDLGKNLVKFEKYKKDAEFLLNQEEYKRFFS